MAALTSVHKAIEETAKATIATGPTFHILICLIQIWDNDKEHFMVPPEDCLTIAEVESIEVSDNYKQLINKASVKFPRGTVIRKTSATVEEILDDAKTVDATLDERGVLQTTRQTYTRMASVADFAYGKRIRIYVGYTTDPAIASLPKFNATRGSIYTNPQLRKKYMEAFTHPPIFDGYIRRCSIDTPIEIECEDLASVLKQFSARDSKGEANLTVNDLLADDGRYKLLEGTGLTLYPGTKKTRIEIGPNTLNPDYTVADILTAWTKNRLYSYMWVDYSDMSNPKPYIVVGRSYFTNCQTDALMKQREDQGFALEYPIYFHYHVAENGLTLTESNKDFLCIQGTRMLKNGQTMHMTLRRRPDWHDGDPEDSKWEILNEIKLTKKMKRMGAVPMGKGAKRVDLNRYTVVPYVSAKIGIDEDDMLQELISYFESFNMTGITGTLTLFGDLQLQSGCKVHLYDGLYPSKNGIYFVDEVITKFGVSGFRQTIKLPYLIARDNNENK